MKSARIAALLALSAVLAALIWWQLKPPAVVLADVSTLQSARTTLPVAAKPRLADYPALLRVQLPAAADLKAFAQARSERPEAFSGRSYPLPEPSYGGKVVRDLSLLDGASQNLSAIRIRELDALVQRSSVAQLQAAFSDGRLSSVELVLYYLQRIQRYDIDRLNAVLQINPDALTIARALDAERAAGTMRGPLHGIPILLKDNIASADPMPTTAGAAALKDWQAGRDAFLVAKIRSAGGIILGKANLSEWANFMDPTMPSGFSTLGGQTRHPYGAFDPLGSSSGSAVGVAAHFATLSIGSETSGSIIQPARLNSVVALRPSLGLVSRDHVIPLAPALDTAGPMARSVVDLAVLLNVISGVDPGDPKTADAAELAGHDFTQDLSLERARRLKVGVFMFEKTYATDVAAREALAGQTLAQAGVASPELLRYAGSPGQTIAALESQGITVVRIAEADLPPRVSLILPQLQYAFRTGLNAFLSSLGAEAPLPDMAAIIQFNAADLGNRAPYNQRWLTLSNDIERSAEEHAAIVSEAQAYAKAWMDWILRTYDVDVLVTGMEYTLNAGPAGVPALTIPAGRYANGQPDGVILSGPYLSEPNLLAIGFALELALQGRVEPPLDEVVATFPQP
jgi:amidase